MNALNGRYAGPALVAIWAAIALWTHWGRWSVDLSALWFAGRVFAEGDASAIYTTGFPADPIPQRWHEIAAALGGAGGTISPYLYPPWVAGAVAPLTHWLSPAAFFNLGYVLNIGALALSVLLAARLARARGQSLALWSLVSVGLLATGFPAQLSLDLNQVQNIVNALTLAAFVLAASRWRFTGGVLLAAAAAIKLSPLILAVIFLAERNWRALAGCAAGCLGFLALNLAICPAAYDTAFLAKMQLLSHTLLVSGIDHSFKSAVYLLGLLLGGETLPPMGGVLWIPAPGWIGALNTAALAAGVVASIWITRTCPPRTRLWLRLQLLGTVGFLTGPLCWTHYLLFQTLLAPGVLGLWPGRGGRIVLAAFALGLSAPVFLALIHRPELQIFAMFWGLAIALAWLAAMARGARAAGQNLPNI